MRQPWENLTKEKVIVFLLKEIIIAIIIGSISYVVNRKDLEDAIICFLGVEILRFWPKYLRWGYAKISGKDENGNVKQVPLSGVTWKQWLLTILFGISGAVMLSCGVAALGAGNLKDGYTLIAGIVFIYIAIRLWLWRALHETPDQWMMRKIYEEIRKGKK